MNDNFYEFAKPILYAASIITALALAPFAFADEDYGSTWQIKCEQRGTGQEVVCWRVEVPNKPVVGIDIPFPEEEEK